MLLLTLLLLPLLALAALPESLSTVTVAVWPLSSPSPVPWLDISYALPSLTTQITKTHALAASPDPYTRLGFLTGKEWNGIAIPSARLDAANNVTVELQLSHDGALYHLGLKSDAPALPVKKGQTLPPGSVKAEVKTDAQGQRPLLNKPVVVNEKGQMEQATEETKSFLQKYWWAIALFVVMQLFVGGGGDK